MAKKPKKKEIKRAIKDIIKKDPSAKPEYLGFKDGHYHFKINSSKHTYAIYDHKFN